MLESNRIYLGDCLEVMKDIDDKSIDCVITDPPYGMNFKSNYRKIKYNHIKNDDTLDWLPEWCKEIKRVIKDNAHIYIYCSWHNVDIFKQELEKYIKIKNILIWVKNNTGMGDLFGAYAPKYEMILFCNPQRKKLNNGRDSNILYFNRTGNKFHPTQKPVDMISYLIEKSSFKGDTILDCFSGSGTTAIACYNTKRKFICIEKEEKYYNLSMERYWYHVIKSRSEGGKNS